MGKTFKRNSENQPKIRRGWGNTKPQTRIIPPDKGGGYNRKQETDGDIESQCEWEDLNDWGNR